MTDRPSRLWKTMPVGKRLAAAEAFWRDEQADARPQQIEAVVALARRLNFRPKSVQALPIDRRSRHLAHLPEVSDAIATRALIAYHFAAQRELMGAFLDALGISHDRGLISDEAVPAPPRERLEAAIAAARARFPREDVDLYVRTLAALDGDTWVHAEEALVATG